METCSDLHWLTQDVLAIARLAVAGGISAIGLLVIYGVTRILNRWRRYDE